MSTDDQKKYISYSDIANFCGVGKTTVHEWVDRGVLPSEINTNGQRKVLREGALEAAQKHQAQNSHKGKKQVLTSEFNKAKAVTETFKAKMARLQYEEKIKELVKVQIVEKRLFELALEVRDALLTIPNRISPELASMTDERKINNFLNDVLREALTSISKRELEEFKKKKLK